MTKVYVLGVGMTPCGKFLQRSLKDLAREAVDAALVDCGLEKSDIQSAFFANATQSPLEGQYMIAGQVALREMGFSGIPVVNVENACASGSAAMHLAWTTIRAGEADIALAVGAEKMFGLDKDKTFAVFNGAWDVHRVDEVIANLARLAPDVLPPPGRPTNSGERSVFMDIYASLARFHMKTFGSTERQMAAAAAKNHHHSVHNPLSQYRKDITTDEVLAARMISWPLTLPMCAPISDGAAAVVLASEAGLKRVARNRAVEVLASVIASGSDRKPEELDKHVCRRAADRAYQVAGVAPHDISVAEVHDASAFAEILQSELLRFGDFGEGGWMAEHGETAIGGRLPINPSGGLESKGHPIGATGLTQIHELVTQLRHEAGPRQVEGARLALAENGGGFQGYEEATASIHILGRC